MNLPATGGKPLDHGNITAEMRDIYDYYYTSHEYSRRHPKPNNSTLKFLFSNGAGVAGNILDYGCGNGRYAIPLLQRTQAHLTGYDISQSAINEFASFLEEGQLTARTKLICSNSAELQQHGPYDLIMMLFGVLSHIGSLPERLKTLRLMRSLITENGRLILTVPSLFRRRPLELLRATVSRANGTATDPLKEPGNIFFTRNIANKEIDFFYHLYTVKGLKEELQEAGFVICSLSPESLLPEWLITQFELFEKIDAALLPLLPVSLGYGICVAAAPA
jgi:SAM-dependent methyltransferase